MDSTGSRSQELITESQRLTTLMSTTESQLVRAHAPSFDQLWAQPLHQDWWRGKRCSKTFIGSNYFYVFYVFYLMTVMSSFALCVYTAEGAQGRDAAVNIEFTLAKNNSYPIQVTEVARKLLVDMCLDTLLKTLGSGSTVSLITRHTRREYIELRITVRAPDGGHGTDCYRSLEDSNALQNGLLERKKREKAFANVPNEDWDVTFSPPEEVQRISFSDALYLTVSAGTMTGLSPIDFTATSRASQVFVWLTILCCSPMLMSAIPVILRRRAFRLQVRKEERRRRSTIRLFYARILELSCLDSLPTVIGGYWFCFQVLGWLTFWYLLESRESSVSFMDNCWHAAFLSTSGFHNAGLITLPGGFPFEQESATFRRVASAMLIFLILAGNSCYPIFLRMVIYLISRIQARLRLTCIYLLADPRRCYTHLFPAYATRWLALISAGLIVAQFSGIFYAQSARNWNRAHSVDNGLSILLDTVATRTAGISVTNLDTIGPGSAWMYCVCMWISASPVVVAMRNTATEPRPKQSTDSMQNTEYGPEYDITGAHLDPLPQNFTSKRIQMTAFMSENGIILCFLFFMILVNEVSPSRDPNEFYAPQDHNQIFLRTAFEFCSCWGTVGLSMSDKAWSYSATWSPTSKFCLMTVMFLGRLRGLPHAIDPSVQLGEYEVQQDHDGAVQMADPGGVTSLRARQMTEPPNIARNQSLRFSFADHAATFQPAREIEHQTSDMWTRATTD